MNYKKIIFVAGFLVVFSFLFNFDGQTVEAMTTAEIQALIAQLQSQVAQLQKQLVGTEDVPAIWCHDFNINLQIGTIGSEVEALHVVLEKEGFNISQEEKTNKEFDESTASAVTGFQEKYRDGILTPLGLKYGTGYIGKGTRAKLNLLYGCGTAKPITPISEPISTPIPTLQATTTPTTAASIGLLSPNGGEQWLIGNTYTIKWENPDSIKSIYLELYKGGTFLTGLGGLGLNAGAPISWTWDTISTASLAPGSDFKIRVRSDTDPTIYDESDNYFNIVTSLPSPNNCVELKSYAATNYYFGLCKKGGYDRVCFNKYYSTYQGCGRSIYYDDCTAQNANAENNIWCDTSLAYACNDSDSSGNYGKDYYMKGTVAEVGKTPAFYKNGKYYLDGKEFIPTIDRCVDSSILKEYFCSISDSYPAGIVSEENYTCPFGCEDGACNTEEKKPALKDIENQLASISVAISQLMGQMKESIESR